MATAFTRHAFTRHGLACTAAAAAVGTTTALAVPAVAAEQPRAYEGTATALQVQARHGQTQLVDEVVPSPVIFPAGRHQSALEQPAAVTDLATVRALTASSGLAALTLVSRAEAAHLSVLDDLLTATVLQARCTARNAATNGVGHVGGLSVAGVPVVVPAGKNVVLEVPEPLSSLGITGKITVNEQVGLPDRALRVRALHLRLSVDPLALQETVETATGEVRSLAVRAQEAVASATGGRLESVAAPTRTGGGTPGPSGVAVTTDRGTAASAVRLLADVVTSEVTCRGRERTAPAAAPVTRAPGDAPQQAPVLPRTGGDGQTLALGATGLGLLLAGLAAVTVPARMRRASARQQAAPPNGGG